MKSKEARKLNKHDFNLRVIPNYLIRRNSFKWKATLNRLYVLACRYSRILETIFRYPVKKAILKVLFCNLNPSGEQQFLAHE